MGQCETLAERVACVKQEIAAACRRSGRVPEEVTLVAISKTHPASVVVEAAAAGLRHFGENRLEEALPKMAEVAALTDQPVQWHIVGHVQSRKVRYLTAGFALMHSLDSLELAGRVSRLMAGQGRSLDVLLEVNVSGEATKGGWNAYRWAEDTAVRAALWAEIAQVIALPGLVVCGLMTMAPIVDEAEQARPVFAALRTLRAALSNDFPGVAWHELSMGMSDDYPVAIEEGATMVRIGRAIFGSRQG